MAVAVYLPVRPKPVLADYFNMPGLISNEGGKGAAAEARRFITAINKTSEAWKYCFFLNTDTPARLRKRQSQL